MPRFDMSPILLEYPTWEALAHQGFNASPRAILCAIRVSFEIRLNQRFNRFQLLRVEVEKPGADVLHGRGSGRLA
jgi:hypothetical protein